jgi:hypothetical protein
LLSGKTDRTARICIGRRNEPCRNVLVGLSSRRVLQEATLQKRPLGNANLFEQAVMRRRAT